MSTSFPHLRESIDAGATPVEITSRLHESGFTIIEAIKMIRELYGVPLNEVKRTVASHPCYLDVKNPAIPLHEETIKAFNDIAGDAPVCE
ncbi:MAG: hypothetical protein CMJ47_00945 [Planctomyces sp.]|nr:hypothetical protein [Planctomyces sp.]